MEPYYSASLSHFKSTHTVASVADLTAYASTTGYSPPPNTAIKSSSAEPSDKTCAKCGGAPKHRCTGCAEGVDRHGNHSPTFYCGKECQQKHWRAVHKRECKAANDRKVLYRAAAILQPLFKAIRRLTWFANVLGVDWAGEDDDRKLVVRFGEVTTGADLHKFPNDMLPDEQAKEALLAAGAGFQSMATMSTTLRMLLQGTCDEARISENGVSIDSTVVTNVLPGDEEDKDDEKSSGHELPIHWFFKVQLGNGELYALDLCTAQFTSTPGEEAWACVVPLNEHLRRLPLSERLPGWQGMSQNLGRQRQRLLNEIPLQSSPEQIMAGGIELEDLGCEAQKFALAKMEEAISQWAVAQSMSPGKALRLLVANFMHVFCTFVWPIELMERELRVWMVLMMMSSLRKSTQGQDATMGPGEDE